MSTEREIRGGTQGDRYEKIDRRSPCPVLLYSGCTAVPPWYFFYVHSKFTTSKSFSERRYRNRQSYESPCLQKTPDGAFSCKYVRQSTLQRKPHTEPWSFVFLGRAHNAQVTEHVCTSMYTRVAWFRSSSPGLKLQLRATSCKIKHTHERGLTSRAGGGNPKNSAAVETSKHPACKKETPRMSSNHRSTSHPLIVLRMGGETGLRCFQLLGRRLTLITCYQNKHPGTLLSRAGRVSTLLEQPHAGPKKPSHRRRFSLYSNLSNRLHGHSYITQIMTCTFAFTSLAKRRVVV